MARKKPHIILISDDQHRYDYLEMTNRYPLRTPHLARLAREGIWYHNAYSPCPLCMPARCSMITGLYAHQNGLTRNVGHWPLGTQTMPKVLQQAGYHTAAIGKLHAFEAVPEHLDLTTVADQVMSLGFDDLHECSGKALAWECDCEWTHHLQSKGLLEKYRAGRRPGNTAAPFELPTEDYMDIYIADRAVEWIDAYNDDKPFFLWAGLVSPHPPFDAPAEYLKNQPLDKQVPPVDNDNPDAWRERRAHYGAMVELVDEQVGRILEALQRRGFLDDALVVFFADHGEMLGDHGEPGKCKAYDPSSRVPCIMRYPGEIDGGLQSDALVEITDISATCVEVATGEGDCASIIPGSPARSLVSHWKQPREAMRPYVYSEDGGQFAPAFQMIRDARWKYVLYTGNQREELFDMIEDPHECVNRADDPAFYDQKHRLASLLCSRLAQTEPPLRDS